MRPVDADALLPSFIKKACTMEDRHGVKLGEEWLLNYDDIKDVIDNAPPVEPQKIVIIPPELIEKLALCVVDIVGNIDWEKAIEAYKARPQGEWKGINEYITHLEEKTGERYEVSGLYDGSVFCNQCWKMNAKKVRFCPNCGADMRCKEEEE